MLDLGDALVVGYVGRHEENALTLLGGPSGDGCNPTQVVRSPGPSTRPADCLVQRFLKHQCVVALGYARIGQHAFQRSLKLITCDLAISDDDVGSRRDAGLHQGFIASIGGHRLTEAGEEVLYEGHVGVSLGKVEHLDEGTGSAVRSSQADLPSAHTAMNAVAWGGVGPAGQSVELIADDTGRSA